MNARIFRWVLLGALASVLAWLAFWWPRSPTVAVLGMALGLCGLGLQLGLQMLLMRRVARAAGAPVPPARVALAAWWAEWGQAQRVFGWRVPFGEQAEPDGWPAAGQGGGQVGVVLVHGYLCNRGFWAPVLRALKAQGIACAAVTLEPGQGQSIDAMVPSLDACARRMAQATGRAPLIVAHSMGGLAARAWLRQLPPEERAALVAHVVTLGTPHRGTWLARFAGRLPGLQMRQDSEWLRQLPAAPPEVPFTCWWTACDNIVFPWPAATLPGSAEQALGDVAHVQLAFDARVWRFCLALRQRLQGGLG
ncbi:MAG: alpha/beta hydrolase [Ottowia sp.]|uniref:esterase/lipase family protein n=1 Tax=Ottowia sp. TaxID=1898956 RepID=UPI0039E5DA3E